MLLAKCTLIFTLLSQTVQVTIMEETDFKLCLFCQSVSTEELRNLTEDGIETLKSSLSSQQNVTATRLIQQLSDVDTFLKKNPKYHKYCRNLHIYKKKRAAKRPISESNKENFDQLEYTIKRQNIDFTCVCFICEKKRDPKANWKLSDVSSAERQQRIHIHAKKIKDEQMLTKIERLGHTCTDMKAEKWKYHKFCMSEYLLKRPSSDQGEAQSAEAYDAAFIELTNEISKELFENNAILEIKALTQRYRDILLQKEVLTNYKPSRLIKRMQKHFNNQIQLLSIDKKCIVCSSSITVGDMYEKLQKIESKLDDSVQLLSQSESDEEHSSDEQQNMNDFNDTYMVAKHTRKAILDQQSNLKETYELKIDMTTTSSVIPNELYNLIASMINKEDSIELTLSGRLQVPVNIHEQTLNICQDIMSKITDIPMPKNVGLALYVLRQTRSKDLVTLLNRFGHTISYLDAQRYLTAAANAVEVQTIEQGLFIPSNLIPGQFTHCALDNLDFAEHTRDGTTLHATSHNIYQPCVNDNMDGHVLRKDRPLTLSSTENLDIKESHVSIQHRRNARCLQDKQLNVLTENYFDAKYLLGNDTFIWSLLRQHDMLLSEEDDGHVPLTWNAFFEKRLEEKPKTTVAYGPLFPSSPTNPDTVKASIDYLCAVSNKLGQETTVITCDQAIYDIAKGILHKEPDHYRHVVIRLGGFHIAENFLGAIGYLMRGSGIEQILVESQICHLGTANKILSGKDYYQMTQYHSIVSEAMSQILWREFLLYKTDKGEDYIIEVNLRKLLKAYESNVGEEIESNLGTLKCILKDLTSEWNDFCNQLSMTGKYWLNYIIMVTIAKDYICSERSGNWFGHLTQVKNMLPYIVAAGHTKYANCIPHYLADMHALQLSKPDIFEKFIEGKFTVHHREGRFNGVWSDMALEQTYNKEGKSSLLKGVSQSDKTREKYIKTVPFLTKVSENIKSMANVTLETAKHYRETITAKKNDLKLVQNVQKSVEEMMFNPFAPSNNADDLVNIATGEKCQSVELVSAREKGIQAIKKANDNKLHHIEPLKIKTFIQTSPNKTVDNDVTQVYKKESAVTRALCFLSNSDAETRNEAFEHEWTDYPSSLFKPAVNCENRKLYTMRKGTKSDFLTVILESLGHELVQEIPQSDLKSMFVVDFMAFVNKFQTLGAKSFGDLTSKYTYKMLQLMPVGCDIIHVVGDRYDFSDSDSLKCAERENRMKTTKHSKEYIPSANVEIPQWKELMRNQKNKANLSSYVSDSIVSEFKNLPDSKQIIIGGTFKDKHMCKSVDNTEVHQIPQLRCEQHEEADTRIVAHMAYSETYLQVKRAIIMCTDTDVIILALYYYCRMKFDEIWIQKNESFLPMHDIAHKLASKYEKSPKQICETLLTTYVFSGCDSTSYPFRKSKRLAAKIAMSLVGKLDNLSNFGVDMNVDVSEEHWNEAIALFATLYGKPNFTNMNELRQHIFANSSCDLRTLPPTDNALRFHMLRCLYQLLIYHRANRSDLELPPATQYGRKIENDKLVPVMTTIPAKPKSVKSVSCKCIKSRCLKNCICFKRKVPCFIACNCTGKSDMCGRVEVDDFD